MAPAQIDFTLLSLKDALDLAILVEDEAEERYEDLAHQLELHRTPEAAAFFRKMAGNEAMHRERLTQRRTQLFGDTPRTVTRAMLWDVEAPELDEVRIFMTPRRAMETSLRCEEKAHAFFAAALAAVREPEVRPLLTELCAEELVHQELVRRELARLGPDAAVNPEDFTDEPTSQ